MRDYLAATPLRCRKALSVLSVFYRRENFFVKKFFSPSSSGIDPYRRDTGETGSPTELNIRRGQVAIREVFRFSSILPAGYLESAVEDLNNSLNSPSIPIANDPRSGVARWCFLSHWRRRCLIRYLSAGEPGPLINREKAEKLEHVKCSLSPSGDRGISVLLSTYRSSFIDVKIGDKKTFFQS